MTAAGETRRVLAEAGARLYDARFILAAAGAVALVCAASPVGPAAAAGGFLVVLAASLVPRRSQTERAAERRRTDDTASAWQAGRAAILDALEVPAYLLNGDSLVVHANKAALALFGPVAEGAHLSSRIRSPGILDMVREAIAGGRPHGIEHSERIPSERWYKVHVAPLAGLPDALENGGFYLLTFQDVTEARRMDRMRSDFVANASHELRTPLASLTGFIETLQGPARDDPAARDRFLAIMLDQAERMGRLIEDLMSLSRLELRAHVAPAERVDLRPLVGHVCDTLRPLAEELGVTIRFSPPAEPATVAGERDELIQVFQNLVENACKYGRSGRYVDVAITRAGAGSETPAGMIDVSVRDHGPGIAPEHVPRLTERFYRVSVETSRMQKGTGLGLAIVKHILTRHRARLLVRSELGKGSVFTARFSAACSPQQPGIA